MSQEVVKERVRKPKEKVDNRPLRIMKQGIFKNNALFIGLLGLCPALAVTTSFESALECQRY